MVRWREESHQGKSEETACSKIGKVGDVDAVGEAKPKHCYHEQWRGEQRWYETSLGEQTVAVRARALAAFHVSIDQHNIWQSKTDADSNSAESRISLASVEPIGLCEDVVKAFQKAIDEQIEKGKIQPEQHRRGLPKCKAGDTS